MLDQEALDQEALDQESLDREAIDHHGRDQEAAGSARALEALQQPLELAYRYLSRRERTVSEMRHHLEQKGVEAASADAVIGALTGEGTLDDSRFARVFAEDKRELEQWGADRIRRALLERGIERELIEAVIAAEPEANELDRALALLQRRFPAPPRARRDRDRALGVLLRKGYGAEVALDALAIHAGANRS